MTKNVKTVELQTSLAHGVGMMRLGKFRHLVLVDKEGTLERVISIKDALNYLADIIYS